VRCEHCGSEDLSYERDALLVATPLRVVDEVLVLDTAPRPAPLDEVQLCCRSCGREQDGVRWEEWRPEQVPADASVIEAEDAMDLIAAYVNERSEVQGADFVEFVCQLLPRTGREVVDSDV
jgi:hypothetical protein